MRTFGWPELLFILEAARWTLALSLIAFIGGAIGGLAIALSRTSDVPLLQRA
jgi:polar amino acid transport system permease protein